MATKKKKKRNPNAGVPGSKKKKNEMIYVWIGVGIAAVIAAIALILIFAGRKAEYEATHGRTTDTGILQAYFDAIQVGDESKVQILFREEAAGWFELAKSNAEKGRYQETDTFLSIYDRLYEYYGMEVVSWDIVTSSDEAPEDYEYYATVMGLTAETTPIETVRDFDINVHFKGVSGIETSVPVSISVLCTDGRWYIKSVLEPSEG